MTELCLDPWPWRDPPLLQAAPPLQKEQVKLRPQRPPPAWAEGKATAVTGRGDQREVRVWGIQIIGFLSLYLNLG